MYCQFCGTQLDDAAFYCSRCGRPTHIGAPPNPAIGSPGMVPPGAAVDPLRTLSAQVRTLGILWAIYSPFRLLMAAVLLLGRITTHMWMYTWPREVDYDPYPIMHMMRGIFVFSGFLSLVTGIVGILAAAALLRRDRAGRIVALVAGFLALISIPFGTALGIYTLVVLLPRTAAQSYERLAIPA